MPEPDPREHFLRPSYGPAQAQPSADHRAPSLAKLCQVDSIGHPGASRQHPRKVHRTPAAILSHRPAVATLFQAPPRPQALLGNNHRIGRRRDEAAFVQEGRADDRVMAPHELRLHGAFVRDPLGDAQLRDISLQAEGLLDQKRASHRAGPEMDADTVLFVFGNAVTPGNQVDLAVASFYDGVSVI